jgi:phenylacetic acid degradation operon negative regulatory protein
LAGRAKFPLEVLDACRAVWPDDRPLSVRISATDWIPGGFDPDQAVAFARMLAKHGCDIVDVSRLGRRLRFLGFGSVQDSVWVSPHDHSSEVADLLGELGVADHATVFLARIGGGEGLSALVSRAWDLTGLEERYGAFCSGFERYLSSSLADREAFQVRTRVTHVFRSFAVLDPELPDELAPLSRQRSRAAEIFDALYTELAASSQRHFDALTAT